MPKPRSAPNRTTPPESASPTGDNRPDADSAARARQISLIASLIVYLIFQVLWATVTPIKMQSVADSLPNGDTRQILVGTGPDEPQHYLYILSMAETGHIPRPLPELRRSPSEFISHEAQHPPLFYAIAAGIRNLLHPLGDRVVWYALRGFGVLCGALAIVLISQMAWVAFPDRPFIGIAMPPFLAMIPMFDYMTSELSNFPLELAFTSAGLLALVTIARGRSRLDVKSGALLAVWFGLAMATRQTSAMWLPAIALVLAYAIKTAPGTERPKAIAGAAVFVVAFAVFAIPWFAYMKANYGSFLFRSDFRPMLGNISLGQYLADSDKPIVVPNLAHTVDFSVMQIALWYMSTPWVPLWLAQFYIPSFFGQIEVFETPFFVLDVFVLLMLLRHWARNRNTGHPDPVTRLLLWASFLSVAFGVALIVQQQLFIDIEMFLYAGRYCLSVVGAGSLLLLFAISTMMDGRLRQAVIGASVLAAVMLLFNAWTYSMILAFYTHGIPGL